MGKYTLRYLPLAKQDLSEIVNYIQNNLENPIAAENTLSKIEAAILERLESPESFAVWQINNPDASVGVCCSHKVVAVGFNTLYYDAERRGIKPSARIKKTTSISV